MQNFHSANTAIKKFGLDFIGMEYEQYGMVCIYQSVSEHQGIFVTFVCAIK